MAAAPPGQRAAAVAARPRLPPFQMTVRDTLDMDTLGYDYAVTTAAAGGTR